MSTTAKEQRTKAEAARTALDALEDRRAALLAEIEAPGALVTKLGEPPTVTDAHRAAWTEAEILTRWIAATTPEVVRLERWAADAEARERERRWKAEQKAREKAAEKAKAAGVAFLEAHIPRGPVERSGLLEAAEQEGVSREALTAGARELGLREYTRFRMPGDYIGPTAWPGAGWQRGAVARL